jgi:hypothetical protein
LIYLNKTLIYVLAVFLLKMIQLREGGMNQRGSTIVESMVCMLLLCLVLFSLLQVFNWSLAKIICQFSSFYAAKGRGLGYAYYPIETACRARAIPVSGKDTLNVEPSPSDPGFRDIMQGKVRDYMGMPSSLNYEYWDGAPAKSPYWASYGYNVEAAYDYGEAGIPKLHADHWTGIYNGQPVAVGNVWIENMPLLDPWRKENGNTVPGLSPFVGGVKSVNMNNPNGQNPDGQSMMYDYSQSYLEDN